VLCDRGPEAPDSRRVNGYSARMMDAPSLDTDVRTRPRRFLVRAGWTLLALTACVLVIRTFVGDVYHVDSGSMEPTLWGAEGGGEWVFVLYTDAAPARQDLIVAQRAGDVTPIVKRVLGLPGETVQVSGGDVLVGGKRLAPSDPRPAWIPVFDSTARSLEQRFPAAAAQSSLLSFQGTGARLDARTVPRDAALGLLYYRDPFQDDYLGPNGEVVRGTSSATDARIELSITLHDVMSQLRIGLSEQGDTFQAIARPDDTGWCDVAITRRNAVEARDKALVLATARVAWPLDIAHRVTFENRDNHVRLVVAGSDPIVVTYRENTLHPADVMGEGKSLGYRAWFGGDSGRFDFLAVEILRDLTYTDRGAFGVGTPCDLGPDEYFLLGDHSSQSRDSREWGPLRAQEIVGRPFAVVWPPSRWRRLGPRESDS